MLAPAVRNSHTLSLRLVAFPLTCLSFLPVEAVMYQMSLELSLGGKKISKVFWEKLAGNLTFFFGGIWVNGEK